MRPGRCPAPAPPPKPACGAWLGAGNNSKPNSTTSTASCRRWSPQSRPAWSPCPGSGRHGRPVAGHRRGQPQRLRSEAAFAQLGGAALIPAASAAPTVIGAIAAATVTPTVLWGGSLWSRCAATRRPGPSRTAHQTGSLQARHHALSQALHRPRALPAPHKPAPARPTHCLNRRHRHTRRISNDGAEREHAAHLPASRCLAALVALSGCAQAELG